jgi:hypothetical protein
LPSNDRELIAGVRKAIGCVSEVQCPVIVVHYLSFGVVAGRGDVVQQLGLAFLERDVKELDVCKERLIIGTVVGSSVIARQVEARHSEVVRRATPDAKRVSDVHTAALPLAAAARLWR